MSMPIAELGYRHWEGRRTGATRRWLAITRSEVIIAFGSSRLLRRLLFVSWMPILYFCPFFLAIGYVADPANDLDEGLMFTEIARELFPTEAIARMREDPGQFLPAIWAVAFYLFFAWSQSFFSMIVVAIAGPPLIARDYRSKAFLIYFSKPIEAWQYLLGKLAAVVFFVLVMTLLPAVLLYSISIALAPDATTVLATLPVLVEIALASLVISIPIGMVVLVISSLTRDRRIATFAWVLLWIFGEIAYRVLSATSSVSADHEPPAWAALLSLRELTMRAASGIFRVRSSLETVFQGLGGAGEGFSRQVMRLAEDLGDPAAVERPREVRDITDLAGLGLSPELALAALAVLCVACAVLVLWRAKKAVRI